MYWCPRIVFGDGEPEALSGGSTCSNSCADGGDTGGVELIATIRKYRMVGNYSKNPNSSNGRRAAGRGTDIIERCEKAGLRTPEFYQDEDFRTILWRPETTDEKDSVRFSVTGEASDYTESAQEGSQKSSQKILELISVDSRITTQAMADNLGVSRRAVAKAIAKLQALGILRRVGPDKGGHWEIISTDR
jgi:hypothetical protein